MRLRLLAALAALAAGAIAIPTIVDAALVIPPDAPPDVPGSEQAAALPISVLASNSLQSVLPRIDASPQYSFADSDLLANSLRKGAPADVFAAAGSQQPHALASAKLLRAPVPFATDRLVLIVPRANRRHVRSLADLKRKAVRLLLGDATVSFGAQARAMLARLRLAGVSARVPHGEIDPVQLARKVAARKADAGIVFATDLAGLRRRLRILALPAKGRPVVTFEIAIASHAPHPVASRAFVDRILGAAAQATLRRAGFGRPCAAPTRC